MEWAPGSDSMPWARTGVISLASVVTFQATSLPSGINGLGSEDDEERQPPRTEVMQRSTTLSSRLKVGPALLKSTSFLPSSPSISPCLVTRFKISPLPLAYSPPTPRVISVAFPASRELARELFRALQHVDSYTGYHGSHELSGKDIDQYT